MEDEIERVKKEFEEKKKRKDAKEKEKEKEKDTKDEKKDTKEKSEQEVLIDPRWLFYEGGPLTISAEKGGEQLSSTPGGTTRICPGKVSGSNILSQLLLIWFQGFLSKASRQEACRGSRKA